MSCRLLWVALLLSLWDSASSFPHRKSVNPCGIAYDHLGSQRFKMYRVKEALVSRIREVLPLLNATFPKQYENYDGEAWIPDASSIDGSIHFSKQLVRINRSLKYFSCALEILEKDLSHSLLSCGHRLPHFHSLLRNHRLLVCETDAAMHSLGGLDTLPPGSEYPALSVDIPSDWYSARGDCTQSGFVFSIVYTKYMVFLKALLSLTESHIER